MRTRGITFLSCVIVLELLLASLSFARIDPGTIKGMWLFDDTKNPYKDYSGNGLDGKPVGNPKQVEGKFGKAIEFDGKSYIEIPAHANPTDAITVTAWAKSATPTWNEHGWLVEKRDAYILHPNQGSVNVSFCVVNGAPWNQPKSWDSGAIGPKDITVWHMYTGTFDSATGKWNIYIDGEVASSMELNKTPLVEEKGPVHIGWDECCGGNRFGMATVDEVAVFSVALGKDDVLSIYKSGLYLMALAVDRFDKLPSKWAELKLKY